MADQLVTFGIALVGGLAGGALVAMFGSKIVERREAKRFFRFETQAWRDIADVCKAESATDPTLAFTPALGDPHRGYDFVLTILPVDVNIYVKLKSHASWCLPDTRTVSETIAPLEALVGQDSDRTRRSHLGVVVVDTAMRTEVHSDEGHPWGRLNPRITVVEAPDFHVVLRHLIEEVLGTSKTQIVDSTPRKGNNR